jgi:hypothetical protein
MIKKIKVYPCGTKVKVHNDIKGKITGINIRNTNVQYEIGFTNNGDIQSKWVSDCEISTITNDNKNFEIGFQK